MNEESPYLKLDRAIVTAQIIHCTGQSPSHKMDGSVTYGFTVKNYGQRRIVVRWVGPLDEEPKQLNRYTQALQRCGYQVERMTEQNLEARTKAQRDEQKKRRNRELIIAKKLKHQPKKERQRRRIHA